VIKPIAALLADADQGPFRVLIIDSIIGEQNAFNLMTAFDSLITIFTS
jgi:hypothetical protein